MSSSRRTGATRNMVSVRSHHNNNGHHNNGHNNNGHNNNGHNNNGHNNNGHNNNGHHNNNNGNTQYYHYPGHGSCSSNDTHGLYRLEDLIRPLEFRVGENETFKTLEAAFAAIPPEAQQGVTILVSKGHHRATLNFLVNYAGPISIIGDMRSLSGATYTNGARLSNWIGYGLRSTGLDGKMKDVGIGERTWIMCDSSSYGTYGLKVCTKGRWLGIVKPKDPCFDDLESGDKIRLTYFPSSTETVSEEFCVECASGSSINLSSSGCNSSFWKCWIDHEYRTFTIMPRVVISPRTQNRTLFLNQSGQSHFVFHGFHSTACGTSQDGWNNTILNKQTSIGSCVFDGSFRSGSTHFYIGAPCTFFGSYLSGAGSTQNMFDASFIGHLSNLHCESCPMAFTAFSNFIYSGNYLGCKTKDGTYRGNLPSAIRYVNMGKNTCTGNQFIRCRKAILLEGGSHVSTQGLKFIDCGGNTENDVVVSLVDSSGYANEHTPIYTSFGSKCLPMFDSLNTVHNTGHYPVYTVFKIALGSSVTLTGNQYSGLNIIGANNITNIFDIDSTLLRPSDFTDETNYSIPMAYQDPKDGTVYTVPSAYSANPPLRWSSTLRLKLGLIEDSIEEDDNCACDPCHSGKRRRCKRRKSRCSSSDEEYSSDDTC